MSAKVGGENFCRVIEFVKDENVVARDFCIIMGEESQILTFAGNLMEISSKLAAIIPVSAMPVLPDGAEFEVEMFKPGEEASQIKNILLEADGIHAKDGDEPLIKYADVEQCWMCYNLVKEINEIKAENSCCARFSIVGAEQILCSNKPSGECEEKLKMIMKKMFTDCKVVQPSATATDPLTCGTDQDYKNEAEAAAEELEANNPGAAEKEAEKMMEDLLANTPSSGIEDVEALIAKIAEIL